MLLHERVAAQGARTPDATALVTGERRVTYAELERRASRLAAQLRTAGAGPERLVGICLERDANLVLAVLAALKAGAGYVPLDPAYPRERLAFMLADARAPVVLASERTAAALPDAGGARVLRLDDSGDAGLPASTAPPAVRPENLAYVIYTSGSTGRPKGVAISHASACSFLDWALGAYGFEELRGTLASTSLSFDLSVYELFAPLTSGGCAILARDLLALPDLPAAGEVTLVNTVPSVIEQLLAIAPALPPSVRTVNLAGEPLPGALARRLYAMAGVKRVVNLYGPSEDTTYSTVAELEPTVERPSIGCPIEGGYAYVLDERLDPVAPGAVGELYLGGAGLARGYLDRPGLTASRFAADRHGSPGARVYRTGDRVRRLPDGELEFLGRRDDQVKLRGFRIELGEIEATLRTHPGVCACAVRVSAGGGDRRLVAYVTADATPPTAAVLRDFLRERLPAHMVPSAFVSLAELPIGPNGKLDRAALPAPPAAEASGDGPAPGTETAVAAIWSEVLSLADVGRDEHFLDLGGHSLLATQIVARLRDACQVELPLCDFLAEPTVAGVAAAIERTRGSAQAVPRAPIGAASGRPAHLSYSQLRLWVLDRLRPGTGSYNVLHSLRLSGQLDVHALEGGIETVVARHDVLRTRFAERDGVPRQVVAPRRRDGLAVVDLRGLAPEQRDVERRRHVEELATAPFDLARDDLLRARLLLLDGERHELLIAVHHIVFDDWSMRVLMRELGDAYDAIVAHRHPALAPTPIQYADYAAWQRRWLQGGTLDALLSFWRGHLAGAEPFLELPADRPRTGGDRVGAQARLELEARLAEDLRVFSRARGVTLYTTLLAAFGVLVHAHTSRTDVVVGTAVAGRDRVETEGLIGNFVNTLALRLDLAGEPTFDELVERARDVALGALAHQDLPFDRLVEELRPPRRPGVTPIVQVAFGLEQKRFPRIELPELTLEAEELFTGEARFDLTLWMQEDGDRLDAVWTYDAALFDRSTVERLHEELVAIARRAVADSTRPLDTLAPVPRRRSSRVLRPREARRTPVGGLLS
jgi:amino acid adenylation domain-containing protein